jgi:CubicO group peptidase (beta-lactamase class C family)
VIEGGIAAGLHTGAQLYVSHEGRVVADVGIGEARPDVPMTPESITLWMSSVKPVAAVAIARLWERGRIDLDDPVAKHIPEFAHNGKDRITLRHVLTHTGGFRAVPGGGNWTPDPWETIIARVCATRPEPRWEPGKKAGYHVASGWFVLGELVRRLSGKPFDQYVREEIFLPLGMRDSWVGMPHSAFENYGERIATYYDTAKNLPDPTTPPPDAAAVSLVRPGGNGRGPVRDLGLFYEMLLNHGAQAGLQLVTPQTVEALVARHRVGMFDHSFDATIDWGLGFIINSNHYGKPDWPYNYGPHASPRTFGHSGYQSSSAFCDPDRALVVAWTCNGFPGEPRHQQRQIAINTAIYEDLDLRTS